MKGELSEARALTRNVGVPAGSRELNEMTEERGELKD
jgi:hypothetical protein